MADANLVPAGSIPVNPIAEDNQPEVEEQAATTTAPAEPDKREETVARLDAAIAKIEATRKADQSMIGKQSNEIGALRAKLEEMSRPPAGPSEDEQLTAIYQAMDNGDMDIREGMAKALAINSNLTAAKVMSQIDQQQKQGKIAEIQGKFLKENQDYEEVVQSGALQPYLDADPMADEYTAFHLWKSDQKIANLQKEYDAKVLAAKEEGAKLAKGAESAGKVLGKQGGTAQSPQVNRPFKNSNEQNAALMDQLKALRSASAQ